MADDDGVGEIFSSIDHDKEAGLDDEEDVSLLIRHRNKRRKVIRSISSSSLLFQLSRV